MIYEKKGNLSVSFVGADANLSALGAAQLEQEAVTELMGELKIDGITAKNCYNAIWVFAKNKIKLLKPIAWNESFTVESFISSITLATLRIDTAIKNSVGEIAAYAALELCALDLDTGRIRKTSTVGVDEKIVKERSATEVVFTKFDESDLPQTDDVTVRSTNIDFCLHTNNVEYIRFLLNTYTVPELLEHPVSEMEICYVNQSFENDTLQIHKLSNGNKDIFAIKKDGQTIVKCEVLRSL